MATHSSILAWRILWTEEPGGLLSIGWHRVRRNEATWHAWMHWRRKCPPTPVFWPGNPKDRGAWWAAVYRVAQSRERLKQLSNSCRHKYINKITDTDTDTDIV